MNFATDSQDTSEPDLNDPMFRTDSFMVYSFKVQPCRRVHRHDWRECPFSHPGEIAKRRDPRVFSYVGIICPDAKQAKRCPRGDLCPFTHSLFEYWLHPTSRGRFCSRPFCFFAHSELEIRPVDSEALLSVLNHQTRHLSPEINLAQTVDLFQVRPLVNDFQLENGVADQGLNLADRAKMGLGGNRRPIPDPRSTSSRKWTSLFELDSSQLPRWPHFSSDRNSHIISRLGLDYLQSAPNHTSALMSPTPSLTTQMALLNLDVNPAMYQSLEGRFV